LQRKFHQVDIAIVPPHQAYTDLVTAEPGG